MHWPPYSYDKKLTFQGEYGWRVHYFGRYGGYKSWHIDESRLAPDMVSFFFVEKNSCWARVNGRKFTLKAGDMLILSGTDEFSFGHDAARPHISLSASLALSQRGVVNMLLQRSFPRRFTMTDPKRYIIEFERVLAAMSGTTAFRDLAIAGALSQWLAYVLDTLHPQMHTVTSDESSVIDRLLAAQAWANVRLKEVITLADWSASVKLNPVYFGRIFRRATGFKPMEWLNQRRLEMAAQYLSGSSKSVSEIAAECGYASPYYFSRRFRSRHGLSPLRYRQTSFERPTEKIAKHIQTKQKK